MYSALYSTSKTPTLTLKPIDKKPDYLVGYSYFDMPHENIETVPSAITKMPDSDIYQMLALIYDADKKDKTPDSETPLNIANLELDSPPPPSSPPNNFAIQIYVGSLTVIGLFIFFRMIQKSR
jgi:hypothetical protein